MEKGDEGDPNVDVGGCFVFVGLVSVRSAVNSLASLFRDSFVTVCALSQTMLTN
jgi:hypothetical protein